MKLLYIIADGEEDFNGFLILESFSIMANRSLSIRDIKWSL